MSVDPYTNSDIANEIFDYIRNNYLTKIRVKDTYALCYLLLNRAVSRDINRELLDYAAQERLRISEQFVNAEKQYQKESHNV